MPLEFDDEPRPDDPRPDEPRPDDPPALVRDLDDCWARPALEDDLGFPPFADDAARGLEVRFCPAVAVDDDRCRLLALPLAVPLLPPPPLRDAPERAPRDEPDDAERLLLLFLFSAIANSKKLVF